MLARVPMRGGQDAHLEEAQVVGLDTYRLAVLANQGSPIFIGKSDRHARRPLFTPQRKHIAYPHGSWDSKQRSVYAGTIGTKMIQSNNAGRQEKDHAGN